MVLSGEVSYKVRRAILLLRTFTIGQLTDITGIKQESVETVVQRLMKEDIVVHADPVRPTEKTTKKGRPRQYYCLNERKRDEFGRSCETFTQLQRLDSLRLEQPQNPHFLKALSLIRASEESGGKITDLSIDEISGELSIARKHEEIIEGNNELVMAHIDLAAARLEVLSGDFRESVGYFERAFEVFAKYNRPEIEAIKEQLLALKLRKIVASVEDTIKDNSLVPRLKDDITAYCDQSAQPLLPLITAETVKLLELTVHVSFEVHALKKTNRELLIEIQSLQQVNAELKLREQMTQEINRDLAEAILRHARTEYDIYPEEALPKSTDRRAFELHEFVGNVN